MGKSRDPDAPSRSFAEVLREELESAVESRKRRKVAGRGLDPDLFLEPAEVKHRAPSPGSSTSIHSEQTAPSSDPAQSSEASVFDRADRLHLFGLALSGGGIRSATFNLGVLQALAELRLLRWVDYLSTVSGGGYIGAWLSAWIQRRKGGVLGVERDLAESVGGAGREPHPVAFLRQYSSYLTPRRGLLGADTWTFISTYCRNLVLTMLFLVLGLILLLLVPHGVQWAASAARVLPADALTAAAPGPNVGHWILIAVAAACLWAAFVFSGLWDARRSAASAGKAQAGIQLRIVLPVYLASVLGSLALVGFGVHEEGTTPGGKYGPLAWMVGIVALSLLCWGTTLGLVRLRSRRRGEASGPAIKSTTTRQVWVLLAALFGGALGGALVEPLDRVLAWLNHVAFGSTALLAFGPPLVVLLYSAVIVMQIGFTGRRFSESSLEWWGRVGGWLLIYSLVWIVVMSISFYGPSLLDLLVEEPERWLGGLVVWALPSLGGFFAARGGEATRSRPAGLRLWVLRIAPYVFTTGLLCVLSFVLRELMVGLGSGESSSMEPAATAIGVVVIATVVILAQRLDINRFSMHGFYRNRLIRCYLGASNCWREEDRFTGFDPEDDLDLHGLDTSGKRGSEAGPLPVLNAALNLVSGDRLAWQQRRASSFTFTPYSVGYAFPFEEPCLSGAPPPSAPGCYRSARHYGDGISLGTCMAISGAAASPNMGHRSTPAMAFLLTMFNVRLGWWAGNPRSDKHHRRTGPSFGLRYLLYELLGIADDTSDFVYLSDGGHFENLGIYELVRRRCRYILVVDAGQDGEFRFEDLGGAIRKCRADFGVDIRLDVEDIRPDEKGRSRRHCAVGEIRYPRAGPSAHEIVGTIVYLKPSLGEDLPADVVNYALENEDFPHQSTGDQWFDESQFESYRQLGYVLARRVLAGPVERVLRRPPSDRPRGAQA